MYVCGIINCSYLGGISDPFSIVQYFESKMVAANNGRDHSDSGLIEGNEEIKNGIWLILLLI